MSSVQYWPLQITSPLKNVVLSVGLLALKNQANRLVIWLYNADYHAAIRGESVGFERNRPGLVIRIRHFQDVMIPPGLRLELFSRVNRGIVLAIGYVAVEESVAGSLVFETARHRDVSIPLVDCHRAGLNDRLARKIALGWYQSPSAVQGSVLVRECGWGEEQRRQDGPRKCDGRKCPHGFLPTNDRARTSPNCAHEHLHSAEWSVVSPRPFK